MDSQERPLIAACSHCGNVQSPLFEARDENRRCPGRFAYARCENCGLISNVTPPSDLQPYYAEEYYAIPSPAALTRLAAREDCKMNAVKRFVSGGRLLEVGPAFGVFASRAKREGFSVTCVERDPRCCEFLERQVGVQVIRSDNPAELLPRLPAFDVIALWHVIEHLEAPLQFVDAAAANLAPGGVLVLGTPNPNSFQFGLMGKAWPHLDAPRHLHLVPAQVLVDRARAKGLEPRLLDSNDADARSWNRFGWQRMIMNRIPGKIGTAVGMLAGGTLSLAALPAESRNMRGSAYTLALQKRKA
jgi:2-polyprenyl-3-methyl-5-hydroxy-6-metoxy-1,4-benzoquinol methylase